MIDHDNWTFDDIYKEVERIEYEDIECEKIEKDKLLKKLFAPNRPKWIDEELKDFGPHIHAVRRMHILFGY